MKKIKLQNLLVVFIIIILSIGITDKTFQNDTFYTIKIGESILKNGVDMLDHFSIHNIMYPYEHWLYDIFVYLIYNKFGFTGLYISNIVLTSIIGFILYFGTKKLYKNEFISFIITVVSIFLLKNFIATRAQLISYIIFVLEIFLLETLFKHGKKRNILALVILSIMLANIHAAVWPMFFILFLPYIVAFVFNKIKNKKILSFFGEHFISEDYTNIKYIIVAFIICLLAGFINPNNNQCFIHFILLKAGHSMNIIAEHKPTALYNNPFFLIYISIIFFTIIFKKQKYKLKNILFISGLLLLSLSSIRHISLFITIGSFILVDTFSTINISKKNILNTKLFLVLFTIFVSVFLLHSNINNKYISDEYPKEISNYINKKINKNDMRLYNEYNYGSYLLFKNIPVFIDSRASLYTKQFNKQKYDIFDDYNIVNTTGKYKKIFKRYNINYVLTTESSLLNYALKCDYQYKFIYKNNNFILYKKI